MRRVVGGIVILAAIGGAVAWLVAGLAGMEVRIGSTRTPLPGARTMTLDAGKHVVFYEAPAASGAAADLQVPAVRVELAAPGGRPLPLAGYFGSFTVDGTDGRSGIAIHTARVPRAGSYVLRTAGGGLHQQEAVVLGRPIGARVVRAFAGAALVAVVGVVVGLLLVFLPRRRPKEPAGIAGLT